MNILLVDVDSKMPNLALMKLSAWHKAKGDEVYLWRMQTEDCLSLPHMEWNQIYVSCIFKKNAWVAEAIGSLPNTEIGGYGVSGTSLPDEIEHLMPDYDLYGCDFSMGFTTRGCFRRCEFCDVWKNEGNFREHAPIEEFWNPKHEKIVFLDNVFNASKLMEEKLRFCKEHGLKVSIPQGFDARLVTKEQARVIARYWPYYSWKFNDTVLYTAWDRMEDEAQVLQGIRNLIEAGVPARRIMPYILVGYNTDLKADLYRFKKLRELGVYPFVMPYDNKPHPMKRWGNRPALFKRMTFEQWHELRLSKGRSY